MSPEYEPEVTWLDDGTPVIWLEEEWVLVIEDAKGPEAQARQELRDQAWLERVQEILRKGRHD